MSFFSSAIVVAAMLVPGQVKPSKSAQSMYTDALTREQTVRVVLASPRAAPATLQDVRAVVAAYEAIVKAYPTSGYSDDALWQAGCLALDAFARFGQAPDRDSGVRLLRRLTASYPTSKLVKQVPEQLARIGMETAGTEHVRTIKEIRRTVLPEVVRITVELDGEVAFHDERIGDPARVFVDLPGTRAAPSLVDQTRRFESDADLVRQLRVGRHPNNTTRIVLDAEGVASYSVYPLYDPYRLVIDCVRAGTTTAAATPKPTAAAPRATATRTTAAAPPAPAVARRPPGPTPVTAKPLTTWLRKAPGMTPQAAALIAETYASGADTPAVESAPRNADGLSISPAPGPSPAMTPAPPVKNATPGVSIARQLGLGVSRIVIDPGHGGHDPGAQGKGVTEAELVLDVALRLEKLLAKTPGTEIILTRRTDDFIPLPERTAIANRESADLFLSIHANASPTPQARGIETYFLNFANNLSAAAVAARENAASGQTMGALPDFLKAIALNNKLDESRDFATQVQHAMIDRLKPANKTVKDLGVKQAPFVVLIGAAMPSVLAEISFVTNPGEARLLKGNVYRQRIAEALFNAIRKYQASLRNVSTVALQ
ncbi:MAG: N-acetylmuramoyl-L-alanine amidase [Acidobacteria bacterium]|nr:N-acetylmuramoyl-L-alanine amidase [Acidobacteriota bacterium]